MTRVTDRQTTITASGITAGGRTHNTEQPHEGVRMLTTEETTHHTTTTGTFDAASRLCTAWQWLETQRQTALEGADVWGIRWQVKKSATYLTDLLHTLQAGEYRLSPLQLHGQGSDRKAVWGAQDALVLKWVALSIEGQLPLHPVCEHVKGHGGGRQSVNRLHALLTGTPPEQTDTTPPKKTAGYAWVCRTDIRGYYRNISKETLLNQVRQHVQDAVLTALINQYLHYSVEDGGMFHTPEKGISRGCALSPLMGALHLYEMDEHFSRQKDIHYARYIDDIVILAKSRWQLRKHTKKLMQWFSDYGFEAHPDKTQIGRTAKGFDWMGAWLTDEGMTDIAPRAKANHREKVRRLYERLARVPTWLRHRRQQQVHARVSAYRKRWNIWAGAMAVISPLLIAAIPFSSYGYTSVPWSQSGFPVAIPSDGITGQILSTGTLQLVAPIYAGVGVTTDANMSKYPLSAGLGWTAGSSSNCLVSGKASCVKLPSGDVAFVIYDGCRSIGFVARSVTAELHVVSGKGAGTVLLDYINEPIPKGAGAPPAKATNVLVGTNSIATSSRNLVIIGEWVLLDNANTLGANSCKPTATPVYDRQAIGIGTLISTSPLSPSVTVWSSSTPPVTYEMWGASLNSNNNPPPAVPIRPVCSLTATGSTDITFQGQITPQQINSAANSKVIAKASSPISLSASCTGAMTGLQPVVELQWTKAAAMSGTYGLKIGVANDVDDNSSGILLSKTDDAVGSFSTCEPSLFPAYDWCDAYKINPGTPLLLYPVVFRNTNTTDKPKSGVHTVTGTLKVVVP